MTAPRQVLPGVTYLLTRRCAQREFLLRPSDSVSEVFTYVLAVAAQRFGILVHAFCVMSNHFHLLVTDPDASLPRFEQFLDSLVARALNVSLNRSGAFWDSTTSYSAVTLVDASDVLDKAVYVLSNPVAAGLVSSGREWPGLWSPPEAIGGDAMQAKRPAFFFRKKSSMPETIALRLTAPPGFGSAENFRAQLVEALTAREREIGGAVASNGRTFLGRQRVLAQKPTDRPASEHQVGGLNPRIAGRDRWKRVEALRGLAEFRAKYREALRALRAKAPDALFPRGTYWLRIAHDVPCESAA
jgi:REP element-mobilizing transposase RayT